MVLLLRLIRRTAQGLRVVAVLKELGSDGVRELEVCYPEPFSTDSGVSRRVAPAGPITEVLFEDAEEPGILQSADFDGLADLARNADVVLELVPPIGDHLIPGDTLFRIHGEASRVSREVLHQSIAIADERTITQDPAFIFRLLADISGKALSPGVNDPTTSVQALDQIERLLRLLGGRDLDRGFVSDADSRVRVIFPSPAWEDFLSIALDETRLFGEGSIQISRRLRSLLDDLLERVPTERQAPVEAQLALLEASVRRTSSEGAEQVLAGTGDRQGVGTPRLSPD